MWPQPTTALPGADAAERARLESRVLVLQSAIATGFCLGAAFGLFGMAAGAAFAIVAWVGAYHLFHAWYVIRYRLAGRPILLIDTITPLFDVSCITAGWVAIGDPQFPLWAIYLYALVGYARRFQGRDYALIAGFIVSNICAARLLMSLSSDNAPFDLPLVTIVLVTTAMAFLANAIGNAWRSAERNARRLAEMDPLTCIANRRTFLERLDELAHSPAEVFSILMLDLDDFKSLNDVNGHLYGDAVLVEVAATLVANIRPNDRIARYGGEEFVVAMPGIAMADAAIAGERLRAAVATSHPTTVTIGCATRVPGEPAIAVLRRADDLLLEAKRLSKNSVRSRSLKLSA